MRDDTTVALNRRARHEFTIDETFEAGLVLTGTEIKSIRAGKANIANAYARIERGEAWLIGADIAPFEQGNRYNHEPKRTASCSSIARQIDELLGEPRPRARRSCRSSCTSRRGKAKLELGLARGKQLHDKRPRHRRPRREARHRAPARRRPARPLDGDAVAQQVAPAERHLGDRLARERAAVQRHRAVVGVDLDRAATADCARATPGQARACRGPR